MPRDVRRGMFQGLGPARCTRVQLRVSRRFNWCSPHQSVRRLIRSPLMASTNALCVPPCHGDWRGPKPRRSRYLAAGTDEQPAE